jgi:hypothetical protein
MERMARRQISSYSQFAHSRQKRSVRFAPHTIPKAASDESGPHSRTGRKRDIAATHTSCQEATFFGFEPVVYEVCAMGLAMARTVSIKSCASGVSIRFFKVTIPIGIRVLGSVTGSALSGGDLP